MADYDITGRWHGYYLQERGQHPISMEVTQQGALFRGEMQDEHTLIAGTCELEDEDGDGRVEMDDGESVDLELVMDADAELSFEELREAIRDDPNLLELSSETGGAEKVLEVMSSLPTRSAIEGEVEGEEVRFSKRYLGVHSASAWNDEGEMHLEVEGHVVRYEGRFEESGAVIRGLWRIPTWFPGVPDEMDRFELRRE